MGPIALAFGLAALAWVLVVGDLLHRHRPAWHWYLAGYPATACRVVFTWRKVAMLNDLSVSRRPPRGLLGDLVVKGDPLRPVTPRLSFPRATRLGLMAIVCLHAGQTPATYIKAADALVHAPNGLTTWATPTTSRRSLNGTGATSAPATPPARPSSRPASPMTLRSLGGLPWRRNEREDGSDDGSSQARFSARQPFAFTGGQ